MKPTMTRTRNSTLSIHIKVFEVPPVDGVDVHSIVLVWVIKAVVVKVVVEVVVVVVVVAGHHAGPQVLYRYASPGLSQVSYSSQINTVSIPVA